MTADPEVSFRVAGVALVSSAGSLFTVRKRGTYKFMLPGGKLEPGESARDAAVRECAEEVGLSLLPHRLVALFEAVVPAANEPGEWIHSAVFSHPAPASLSPRAEIEEVRALDLSAPLPTDLAPLVEHHLVPYLRATLGIAV